MADNIDLSGVWKGIFQYPRALPPGHFDAELRDRLGAILGETFEFGDTRHDKGASLHAFIEGHRNGSAISFVKRYDAVTRSNTPVFYAGTVDDSGDEISGTWDIPGQWSGTFLMIRSKPTAAMIEASITETVR
jgi:hypothetical protein